MPSNENRMKALRALEKEALTTQEVAVRVGVGWGTTQRGTTSTTCSRMGKFVPWATA
jgi:hypothetical protein